LIVAIGHSGVGEASRREEKPTVGTDVSLDGFGFYLLTTFVEGWIANPTSFPMEALAPEWG